jgi:hypothetical protein
MGKECSWLGRNEIRAQHFGRETRSGIPFEELGICDTEMLAADQVQ